MHKLVSIKSRGMKVLTSAQIAECYNTTVDCIKQNFHANKNRFVEGKHYIALTGAELKEFKNEVRIPHLDKNDNENEVRIPHSAEMKVRYQFDTQFKYAKSLYLWTEKGALLHAKSLNTDKAWEAYDYLVDFYFRTKEEQAVTKQMPMEEKSVPSKSKMENLPAIKNPIKTLNILLQVAESKGIEVTSYPFKSCYSALKNDKIGIQTEVTVERACYELAFELAHAFIHYDNGNMIESPLSKQYNEQAARAAVMILNALDIKVNQK